MNASFFENNRQALRRVVKSPVIIIAGHKEMQRKADAAFQFVQEANFYYLTGIKEAGWLLIFEDKKEILVAPHRSETQTIFDGSLSQNEAKEMSGILTIISYDEYLERVVSLASRHNLVGLIGPDPHASYYDFAHNPGPEDANNAAKDIFKESEDIRPSLAKLRSIKQPEEIEMMKKAIAITIDSFQNIKSSIHTFKTENDINARLYYDFYKNTSDGHAYDPIVASGKNACTLHYGSNNQAFGENDLVLIDAGAQYGDYAADITRTYATGQPTDRMKEVHAAVQKAHFEIIEIIKPGLSFEEYSRQSDEVMKKAVASIGLLKSDSDMRKYFPHAISHGLGIDVHESLGGHKVFTPGMVLTVEPGIYIPEEGIGVRIEDDILVTSEGNENLTAALSTEL